MSTTTTTKPATLTHTLACGHCRRVIATRRGTVGEDAQARHDAHDWLMGIWRMHVDCSGHPGMLATLAERIEPAAAEGSSGGIMLARAV